MEPKSFSTGVRGLGGEKAARKILLSAGGDFHVIGS